MQNFISRVSAFLVISFLFSNGSFVYGIATMEDFHLKTTSEIKEIIIKETGSARVVGKTNFPILEAVICFVLEIWDLCQICQGSVVMLNLIKHGRVFL